MDFGVRIDETRRSEGLPHCSAVEAKEISTTVGLEPVTPDSNRENSELVDSKSPITVLRKPVKSSSLDSTTSIVEINNSSLTPKEAISDSFATKAVSAGRRLEFDSVSKQAEEEEEEEDGNDVSEEEILDAVYQDLLEVIIKQQAEDVVCEFSSIESDLGDDGSVTPTLVDHRRLSSVADTCPRAPMKSKRKVKDFDMGICRKLEF